MTQDDELVALARLGIEAEAFALSPLGKHLARKAASEIEAATQELIAADPDDIKANTTIRNQIHVANMFIVWVREAVNTGLQAHDQLKALDE